VRKYAGAVLSDFSTPSGVEKAIASGNKKDLSVLFGALGAVEKGGKAVGSDESSSQQAAHYWRVLNGLEKQKLGPKDFKKISELVSGFLSGPPA
jgi:hypothetical protein